MEMERKNGRDDEGSRDTTYTRVRGRMATETGATLRIKGFFDATDLAFYFPRLGYTIRKLFDQGIPVSE
ncbi:hypothetical protein F5146DRAFT_1146918 [Armillaria mellea]|nr:hypothetical protein F5146DRAFT_1146916 [Armillaria mellea]KAK0183813.1 hypothetical protein F5146DRAFT_1146918 [Armillaria mellea]